MQNSAITFCKESKRLLDEILAEYTNILRAVESAASVASLVEKLWSAEPPGSWLVYLKNEKRGIGEWD